MQKNKKKIVTIVGARPQIIKSSVISRVITQQFSDTIEEVIIHTGQHYSINMSDIFFQELNIPAPLYNIKVGSGSHGIQTSLMINGIEEILLKEKPDAVVLYGDTNTTIAGAVAASKIHIPIVHIESGLRSHNKRMPEELNRITCDHMSSLMFVPTLTGIENLSKEGFLIQNDVNASINNPNIYHCGDIMYDNSLYIANHPILKSTILNEYDLNENSYILFTVHRDSNTDLKQNLIEILSAIKELQHLIGLKVVLPLHPRTRNRLDKFNNDSIVIDVLNNPNIHVIDPVGIIDITELEKNARLIVTDSGGVQKEAYFFKKPCVILREQTEWVEMVENGNAILSGANKDRILSAAKVLMNKDDFTYPPIFGDGKAGAFICSKILSDL